MTYRAPLAEMEFCATRIVGQDRLAKTELFADRDWLRRPVLKRWIEDHAAARADHTARLWSLLLLSRWLQRNE